MLGYFIFRPETDFICRRADFSRRSRISLHTVRCATAMPIWCGWVTAFSIGVRLTCEGSAAVARNAVGSFALPRAVSRMGAVVARVAYEWTLCVCRRACDQLLLVAALYFVCRGMRSRCSSGVSVVCFLGIPHTVLGVCFRLVASKKHAGLVCPTCPVFYGSSYRLPCFSARSQETGGYDGHSSGFR